MTERDFSERVTGFVIGARDPHAYEVGRFIYPIRAVRLSFTFEDSEIHLRLAPEDAKMIGKYLQKHAAIIERNRRGERQ